MINAKEVLDINGEQEHNSDIIYLFRGLRNDSSQLEGSWWTQDAFYALEVSGEEELVMMVVSKRVLDSWFKDGKAVNQTYRERNNNESEIEFRSELPVSLTRLAIGEIKHFSSLLKTTSVFGNKAVKRMFRGSGVKRSQEIAKKIFE